MLAARWVCSRAAMMAAPLGRLSADQRAVLKVAHWVDQKVFQLVEQKDERLAVRWVVGLVATSADQMAVQTAG